MALYGAPVWCGALSAATRALLRRPQRVVALRMCRAYQTVAAAAACVLAGTPPWDLEAEVLAEVHNFRRERRVRGENPAPQEHTLEVCCRWIEQRRTLVATIGRDLSLPSVVAAMLRDERSWDAVASFCVEVMTQKEAAEREREDAPDAPPLRRRRAGRRRRQFAAQLLPH
ncbi:uncharacterized protein LOC113228662 [Hyposmocoma kahamanoa]|uniref:uncharacterized protein LOC113228662 n=1 Tax=Hyposmocoma kahamanoa TaxID=1477025 RepID=UPI000E6D9328|nr:uncharacterized protein LOC113228662 [Hyposmocoma kahamanoa]